MMRELLQLLSVAAFGFAGGDKPAHFQPQDGALLRRLLSVADSLVARVRRTHAP